MCLAQIVKTLLSRADVCILTGRSREQVSSSYKTARQMNTMRSQRKRVLSLQRTPLHPLPCSQSPSICIASSKSRQLSQPIERQSRDHVCCERTKTNIKETLRQRLLEYLCMLIKSTKVITGVLKQNSEKLYSTSQLVRALHHS